MTTTTIPLPILEKIREQLAELRAIATGDPEETELERQLREIEGKKEVAREIVSEVSLFENKPHPNECTFSLFGHSIHAKWSEEFKTWIPVSKLFTEEDMRKCFDESRLTHPMVGFKHDTFDSYLKSISK